jgi:hypothetical protein
MERLPSFRIYLDERVAITLLQREDVSYVGRFIDWSHDVMRVKLDADLELGSLLTLEIGNDVMVAEVRHCESDGTGHCAGLFILEWIEKSELKRLLREAVADPVPQMHSLLPEVPDRTDHTFA